MYQLCFFVCYLLLCIVTINGDPGKSRKYYIIEGRNPSYVYRKFDNVEEEMFPKEISVQVAFSKTVGTLIYSVDKHRNQFIVTMRDDVHYETRFGLQVEFNTQWIDVSLAKLCTCDGCKFDHLASMNLRFQINDYIILQCNGGRTMRFTNQRLKKIDTNYPVMYSESDSTTGTGNEAHLWLVNHPIINNVYPNYYQMYGCIFYAIYKEETIIFTNISTNIGSECPESCKNDMCNGGECFVRYSNESVCDCTDVFRNGPSCGDEMRRRNFKADSQSILMKMFKLSWKSDVQSIFLLNNTFVRVAITSNGSSLFFEYSYSDYRNISRKEILLDIYKPNTETICLVYFKEFSVEFRVSNNAIWKTTRIWCPSHFGNEYFHSITMRSGTGVIDIVYKSAEEYQWEKLNVINPIEIKDESTEKNTTLIIAVTILLVILIIVALSGIIIWQRKMKEKEKIHLTQIDLKYEDRCMKEIGWDICIKNRRKSLELWKEFITKKYLMKKEIQEKIFDLIIDSKDSHDFMRNYIVMFIHCRIFLVPSMISGKTIHASIGSDRSLDYLLSNLKNLLTFNNESLCKCMMDLLQELSFHYRYNESIRRLVDAVVLYVSYHSIIYDYTYDYIDLSVFESFVLDDNSQTSLWVSVILCDKKYDDRYYDIIIRCLNHEANKSADTKEITIAYMVLLRIISNNDKMYTFTDMDYQFTDAITRYYCMLPLDLNNEPTKNIFDKLFQARLMKFIDDKSPTDDERIFINCLFVIIHLDFIYDDFIFILPLLEKLELLMKDNIVAIRIVEIIMYKLYENRKNIKKSKKESILKISWRYWRMEHANDEIRLASSLIIMHVGKNTSGNNIIRSYLKHIVPSMTNDQYLGFSRLELQYK